MQGTNSKNEKNRPKTHFFRGVRGHNAAKREESEPKAHLIHNMTWKIRLKVSYMAGLNNADVLP